jgi:hypothetical protein
MGKKSKVKGSSFENSIATIIRKKFLYGLDAKTTYNLVHRTPLSGGHVERGDIILKPPVLKYFPWFIECRNRESWDWKHIWEKGDRSIILEWFLEDADLKCHPYDNNSSPTHARRPLLLFTKNFHQVYFAVWESDLAAVLGDMFKVWQKGETTRMLVYVDRPGFKGRVIIGDFEEFLSYHCEGELTQVHREVAEYLGRDYEPENEVVDSG